MVPTSARQWHVAGTSGFQDLKLQEAPIPKVGELDVLVQFKYVSLNYRDLLISKGIYPFIQIPNVIPGSDGAGVVAAVGSGVTQFQVGDRVVGIFTQKHQAGPVKASDLNSALGAAQDGVLREYGVLPETGLVKIPESLDFQQASALPCAAVTAWNALYGVQSKRLMPGQWVLTQGTGGVSVFGVQFAKAAGARVIATTSSLNKAETLKKLGADHVINYKEVSNWGEEAKKLTGGEGVDHILEVGGSNTMRQSLAAIKIEGVISIIGFVGGAGDDQPNILEALMHFCIIRGLAIGSRAQFEEMNACIEATKLKPVVDKAVFEFQDLPKAYQYLWDQKHFGKVTVKVAS